MVGRGRRYWRNLSLFAVGLSALGFMFSIARVGHQSAMAYVHPPRIVQAPDDTPARFGVDFREISLRTADGVDLSAWYTPAQNGALILVAHGYAGVHSAELHTFPASHGYGVISWDARAHGRSGGATSSMGYFESLDVEAALDYALQQATVAHVGALGQSMGAATIIRAAAHRAEIEAVVADSSFPALDEMLDRVVPFPILRPFVGFFAERETGVSATAMRPTDEIARISPRPVFIIQGEADSVIPTDSAQRLYAAAGEPRLLWTSPGVDHVGMRHAHPDEYDRRVIAFFDASLLEN